MLANYLKVAWRNLVRHKGYSFINIVGLAVGLGSCLMILLWVRDETSFDRFHANAPNLYRVIVQIAEPGGGSEWLAVLPPDLGPALKAEFPEIRQAARHLYVGQQIVSCGEKKFYEDHVSLVDPEFLQMFSFPLRRGAAERALSDPRSIVLTESAAAKYFGQENPMGKILRLNNRRDCIVTGILADLPAQSHLTFEVLLPFLDAEEFGFPAQSWERFSEETYVLVENRADIRLLNQKIASRLRQPLADAGTTLSLQPLTDIHLQSAHISEGEVRGDVRIVVLFSLLALFVLFMAGINYLNLATAQGSTRGREISLRKVTGARRGEIAGQFLGESYLQTALAMMAALILVIIGLPLFNTLSGKHISLDSLLSPATGLFLLGFFLLTGFLAGLYPAWYLSRLQPAVVLKGQFTLSAGGSRLRKLLVVFQFCLTISLIIGSVSIRRQLDFLRTQQLGFHQECVLMVPLRGDLVRRLAPLKAELLRNSHVLSAAAASDPVMMFGSVVSIEEWEGKKPGDKLNCAIASCDEDFLKTHGIQLVQGRFFSDASPGSQADKVVVNETAVRSLGFEHPIGKHLNKREIIGVVKDFHTRSLHSPVGPTALIYNPARFEYLFIKLTSADGAVLEALTRAWNRLAPDYPFEYSFLDQRIDRLYRADQRLGGVVNVFTLLALLIANLGLLGLASHLIARRRKEIGVRKVLGARMSQILLLLSREFIQGVAWAALIACPVAFLALDHWLRGFAYRISIGVGIFAFSIMLAFGIAWLTIGLLVIRAARANPVESLRYE
jgi:putative ABC transport system permease protein